MSLLKSNLWIDRHNILNQIKTGDIPVSYFCHNCW